MRGVTPRDRYGRVFSGGGRNELARDGEPEDVVNSAREACRRGIVLFNERRFYEAHEFFEYAWKGVTQVAVGCCHTQRGNGRGALSLLTRASDQFRSFPSPRP